MSFRLLKVYGLAIFLSGIASMFNSSACTFAYFSPVASTAAPVVSPVTRYGQIFASTVSFGTGTGLGGSGAWGGGSLGDQAQVGVVAVPLVGLVLAAVEVSLVAEVLPVVAVSPVEAVSPV